METPKYFVFLLFLVTLDPFYAKVSPLNNQTYLLTSGSHGLKITNLGQSYIYSGVWTHIFHIKFPDILYQNFTVPDVCLKCDIMGDPYPEMEEICERYNKLINTTVSAAAQFNQIYHKKFDNLMEQQTINSWIIRKKRSLFPIIGSRVPLWHNF